jgi:hypothetical protein
VPGGQCGRREGGQVATTATPRVDIGALAASIVSEVYSRLSISATTAIQWCNADESPRLTEVQQSTLLRSWFLHFDGLEPETRRLKFDLESQNIGTWGLNDDLEALVGESLSART